MPTHLYLVVGRQAVTLRHSAVARRRHDDDLVASTRHVERVRKTMFAHLYTRPHPLYDHQSLRPAFHPFIYPSFFQKPVEHQGYRSDVKATGPGFRIFRHCETAKLIFYKIQLQTTENA